MAGITGGIRNLLKGLAEGIRDCATVLLREALVSHSAASTVTAGNSSVKTCSRGATKEISRGCCKFEEQRIHPRGEI